MTLETWIVVWLQIGLVAMVATLFARTRVHASLRQAASRGVLLLMPALIFFGAASLRKTAPLPAAPISFATPVARFVESQTPPTVTAEATTTAPSTANNPWSLGQELTFGWALISFILLARIGVGAIACRRFHRGSRPHDDPQVSRILADLGASTMPIRVGAVPEPLLMGVWRPCIYLPEEHMNMTDEELRTVLVHEVAHIQHNDLRWRLLAHVMSAILWPQPAVRLLARSLAHCDEERCDQEVLASGVRRAEYAGFLVTLAEGKGRQPLGAVAVTSGLGRRVKLLLSKGLPAPRNLDRKAKLGLVIGQVILLGALVGFIGGAGTVQGTRAVSPLVHKIAVKITDVGGQPMRSGVVYAQFMDQKGKRTDVRLDVHDGVVTVDPLAAPEAIAVLMIAKSDASAYSFGRVYVANEETHELQLLPKAAVSGVILTPDGTPAGNQALVSELLTSGKGEHFGFFMMPKPLQAFTTTDSAGRFTTDAFPAGTRFKLDCPSLTTSGNENRFIEVKSNGLDIGTIRYELGATVEGQVTRDGVPVAAIEVGAQSDGEWGSAITDANGRYSIRRLPADKYNVALKLEDQMQKEVTAVAHGALTVVGGKTVERIDFQLIPGAIIRGKVVTRDGKPKEGAMIGVYGPAHPQSGAWVQSTVTDKNGEYLTRVPAGQQHVYIMEMFEGNPGNTTADVTVEDGKTVRVDFTYPVSDSPPPARK